MKENRGYFKEALAEVLKVEGFYSDDPDDLGGETIYGISRVKNPSWKGWILLDKLKTNQDVKSKKFRELVEADAEFQSKFRDFYYYNYFSTNALDISKISHKEIAIELFDTAVNMGVGIAPIFLQTALNLLNRNQKDYDDLLVDGLCGPVTLNAFKIARKDNVLKCLNGEQYIRYKDIVINNPRMEKYFNGWLVRVKF